jgi:hypothetical protein
MFTPQTQDVRRFFCEAWQKKCLAQRLTPLETLACEWLDQHPEYETHWSNLETALHAKFTGENGQTNPFLHVSMHLSISEQVSIDQPPGIAQAFNQLAARHRSAHQAHHALMECLGHMLWQAQSSQTPFDGQVYMAQVQRLVTQR